MLTTRFWGVATMLLCALLLQNCQSSSLRVIEEKGAAGTSPQAVLGLAAHQPQNYWQAVVQDSSIQRTAQAGAHIQNTSQEAPEDRKPPAIPVSVQDSSTLSPVVWLERDPVLLQSQRSSKRPRTEEPVVGSALLAPFGAEEWEKYFGAVVGPAPALPINIDTILESACPFWPDKKVKDTHLLVLIPATVDGAPFILNLLGKLIQRPKNGGHETRYRYYASDVQAQFGAASPECSYWLLMTRDVLEGSRNKASSDKKALVESHASRTGHPYEVPRALEAATAILMHHARTGERLFGDNPYTFTRCQELADGKYPVVVGGFGSSGLSVRDEYSLYRYYAHNYYGVACCRKFNEEQNLQSLRVPDIAFGVKEWKYHFGDVVPAPASPGNINTILDSACPFWPGRKVRDTHLLVLMPATVDGAPFTLNLLGELIQRPKNGGHKTRYRYYDNDVKAQFGAASPECSYWLLMTRDVLEGSRSKPYSDQKALVASYTGGDGHPYEVPGALEAATAILMHHARTGERLFGDAPRTYTRCQELEDGKHPVVVGGFESSGLRVSNYDYGRNCSGVAGCRRFYEGDE
jgi:hypothetical protein